MEQVATLISLFSPSENWTCTWKAAPRLFKTSSGCSQPRISANGRDTTRTEISFADDPAERQFAAEWDLLNTRFGAWRFVLAFAAKNFSGSLRHCAPSLCE
jgi:hypothetical protein